MTSRSLQRSATCRQQPLPRRQRGAAQLFITIALLVVIMMLGITATIMSSTQYKLAGNLQFESVAFDKAESAAAVALNWLANSSNAQSTEPWVASSAKYLYPISSAPDPFSMNWDDQDSLAIGDGSQRYIVQQIAFGTQLAGTSLARGDVCNSSGEGGGDVYRITARGTSAKGTTKIVQTNFFVSRQCKN